MVDRLRRFMSSCALGLAVLGATPAALADAAGGVDRFTDASFCAVEAGAAAGDLSGAIGLYQANRARDAAAGFAAVARRSADAAERTEALIRRARALKVVACDRQALETLDEAVRSADAAPGLARQRCHALGRRARLITTRDMPAADRLAQEVLACAAAPDAADTASEAHTTRAIVALARSDYAAAELQLRAALDLATSPLARSEALRTRGTLLLRAPDATAASADFAAAADAARAASDPEALALAQVWQFAAGAGDAVLAEVLDLAVRGELRRVVATAWDRRGRKLLEAQTGSALARAVRVLRDSAAMYEAIGDPSQERVLQLQLGGANLLLGDRQAAAAHLQRARALALGIGLPREAAKSDVALGTLARLAEPADLVQARTLLEAGLGALRAQGDDADDIAQALGELAAVKRLEGDAGGTLETLREALAMAQRRGDPARLAPLYANLGWAASAVGDEALAQAAWRAALDGPQPQARAIAWWGLAFSVAASLPEVAAGRYARAVLELEQVRPAAGDVSEAVRGAFDRRFSELYREFAALLVGLRRYAEAHRVALLTQRQELAELRWSGTRTEGGVAPAPPGAPDPLQLCPATVTADEQRMRVLWREQGLLRSGAREACCADGVPSAASECAADPQVPAYCQLRGEVRTLQRSLLRAQSDCVERARGAAAQPAHSEMAFSLSQSFIDRWAKSTSGQKVHLVVTIVEDHRVHVLLRAPGERTYRVRTKPVPVQRLAQWTAELRAAWSHAERTRRELQGASRDRALAVGEAQARRVLRELHDLLFDGFDPPALPETSAQGETVAFVLDRVLRDVPMGALFDGRRYLVERFATAFVTDGTTAAAPWAGDTAAAASLVVGVSYPDLPHVEREINAVAQALQTTPHLNEASTRRRVIDWLEGLAPASRGLALHLASHATMGGTQASSHVRLWGDDRLTGLDFDDLREGLQRVQLVALSACETAASGDGELVLGLAGLAERGARSVLGSLWRVDDDSTSRLMSAFYTHWRRAPGAGVAEALAKAEREVMGRYGHPYFWASFGIVGRWD